MSPITRLALVCLILAPAAARGGPVRFPDPQERLRILARQEARQVAPGEPALRAGQADYDVGFSSLDIDISDTANRRIYGAATHEIRSLVPSLTSVALDLVTQLTVDSVKVNGVPALFTRGGDQILTTLPSPLGVGQSCTLRVVYHGTPPQTGFGLYFDTHNNKAFVWNLSEPDGCRYWWPCKDRPDDKADSMDIRIIVPSWMTAASNGALRSVVSVTPSKLRYSWHVSYPIVPYLVSVAAGDFVRIDGTYPVPGGGTMPLAHYVFPELLTAATEDFNIAVPALDAYSSRFGPYPFLREKYGVSVFGWGGGMEHQTNTSYGWFLITGWHDYDWVYVHEMAHQWWGDNVTCATWADTWLNEGFASWAEAIWAEDQGGAADYRSWMVNVQTVSDPTGPVYN